MKNLSFSSLWAYFRNETATFVTTQRTRSGPIKQFSSISFLCFSSVWLSIAINWTRSRLQVFIFYSFTFNPVHSFIHWAEKLTGLINLINRYLYYEISYRRKKRCLTESIKTPPQYIYWKGRERERILMETINFQRNEIEIECGIKMNCLRGEKRQCGSELHGSEFSGSL